MNAQGKADLRSEHLTRAAQWLTRLREPEELSAAEFREWLEFIGSSEERAAFEAVRRVASAVPHLKRPSLPSADELANDEYDGSQPIQSWHLERQIKSYSGFEARNRGRWLFGAAAVLLIGLSVWFASGLGLTRKVFETAVGEQRLVTLADGSKILLGAKTSVDVRYTASRRQVRLIQGEALFTVAHNRYRPFVVSAGARTVTALGTEFNIWRNLDRTTVTVTEGTVEVRPLEAQRSVATANAITRPAARVSKGQKLTYSEDGLATPVQAADLSLATAWREGRLMYRHVPLKYVIADVNRYFRQQFEIGDLAVGELQFSGAVLQSQSTVEFMHALEKIFPVEAVQVDGDHIVIRSRTPEEPRANAVKT